MDDDGKFLKAYGFYPEPSNDSWSSNPIWQAEISNDNLFNSKTIFNYFQVDNIGYPDIATTSDGVIDWRGIKDSFGSIIPIVEDFKVNLRFPGQYWDSETDLNYNFHRDYKPSASRYIQSDPMGALRGHLYGYVNQSPLQNLDYVGLSSIALPLIPPSGGVRLPRAPWWVIPIVLLFDCKASDQDRCERDCDQDDRIRKNYCHYNASIYGRPGTKKYKNEYSRCARVADDEYVKCYQECANE